MRDLTLSDVKRDYARKRGYPTWGAFMNDYGNASDDSWEEIAESYAQAKFEQGVQEGRSTQAILELQARDRFLKELKEETQPK